jgi:hypothetical protein
MYTILNVCVIMRGVWILMVIVYSKGSKGYGGDLYHLYLHKAFTWGQVLGILEGGYEVRAVCVDLRGDEIEEEDILNIESIRLAKVPICLLVEEGLDINVFDGEYGNGLRVEYTEEGLVEFLSGIDGIDVTKRILRFIEDGVGSVDLGVGNSGVGIGELEIDLGTDILGVEGKSVLDMLDSVDEVDMLDGVDEIDILDGVDLLGGLDEVDI